MNKSKGERIFDQLQKLGFLSPNLDFPLFFSSRALSKHERLESHLAVAHTTNNLQASINQEI